MFFKNNNFDILRIIAAFQVVFMHSMAHLKIENLCLKDFGMIIDNIPGVSIFFLISGYLIAMSYKRNSNLKDYIWNRVLRIYPALYMNIFLGVVILYIFGKVQFNFEFFSWLLGQMTIIQFYNIEMFRDFGIGVINGSLWTISVELTFYILLPILFILYKKSIWFIVLLFIFSFLLGIYDINDNHEIFSNKLLHISILPYLFIFIIGIGFYKFHEKLIIFLEDKIVFWLLLYILYIAICNTIGVSHELIYTILKWLIFSFMIFSFAFSYRGLSQKVLKGNDYTYGIYIYHMLVINVFVHVGLVGEVHYLVYVYMLSIFLGMLSWHLLEKPILGLKKHSLFSNFSLFTPKKVFKNI